MSEGPFSELDVFISTDDTSEITVRDIAELQQYLRNEWEPTGEADWTAFP